MEEMNHPNEQNTLPEVKIPPRPVYTWEPPPRYVFSMGKQELLFAVCILIFSCLACNSLIYFGMNLGFAMGMAGVLVSTFVYLCSHGHKANLYTGALLALSLAIIAAFPRSADNPMKFLMVCLLLVTPSLAFCLMAGQNRRPSGGIASLLDAPRVLFGFGFGRMTEAFRGIVEAFKSSGTVGKTGGAVALGLIIAIPLLVILIPLLMSADAAFEGLLDLLPEFGWDELLTTVIFGFGAGCVLYTQGTALHHMPKADEEPNTRKGLNTLTVNTVLIAVALVYTVYLFSQLAYFVGGFSGILPEDYTMAEYARRGFFEMAWLCAINLSVIALSIGLVTARGKAPLLTKILCLFLGLVTLFFVTTASAKMFLYIGSYGLTRLRVLTEVFMLWLGFTTVFVCIWLFREKLPYLKLSLVLGMIFCVTLMWADVDTQVAKYNVRAYQSGQLETVDVWYLRELNSAAVPYLEELTKDSSIKISGDATNALRHDYLNEADDLRGWNLSDARAAEILKKYKTGEDAEAYGP